MLELTLQHYKKKNEALWWSGGGIEQTGPAWNLMALHLFHYSIVKNIVNADIC